MSTGIRLTVFAAVLVLAFVVGLAVGDFTGPIDTGPSPVSHGAH